MASFSLSKWYLDVVGPRGDAWIGYWALLRWRGVTLRYACTLAAGVGESPARQSTTLRAAEPPRREGDRVTWTCAPLEVEARWQGIDPPIEASLFESGEGGVSWRCWQPRGRATVRLNEHVVSGLGYVEEIELTLPPWRLPLSELRWGRFLGDEDSVVWIDWRGTSPARHVFVNGARAAASRLDEAGLGFDGGELSLIPGRVLRGGALGSTALSMIPKRAELFPLHWLMAEETKWLSPGILTSAANGPRPGWAIHEIVTLG